MLNKLEAHTGRLLENAAMVMPLLIGLFPSMRQYEIRAKRIDFLKKKAIKLYENHPRRAYFMMATAQKEEQEEAFKIKVANLPNKKFSVPVDSPPAKIPPPPNRTYYSQHSIDLQKKYLRAELEIVTKLKLDQKIQEIEEQLTKFSNAKPGFID